MRHSVGRVLRAFLVPVAGSVGAAELGFWIVRSLVPADQLRSTHDVVGNYLQTLGTIYGVLIAFVVFIVWTQYNDARNHVEKEANELLDLFRCANALPARSKAPIHCAIEDYVNDVLDVEWPAMASGRDAMLRTGTVLLDRIWQSLYEFQPHEPCHTAVHAEMLSRFNDLSDARSNRIVSCRSRIPLPLTVFVYVGGIVTVGSMYLFSVDAWWVQAVMIGAMAGMISHLLYIIYDLDNCFEGEWQVPREAFEGVRNYVRQARESARREA